jgi:hypothetical protein
MYYLYIETASGVQKGKLDVTGAAAIFHRSGFCLQGWNNVASDIKQKVQKTFDCCGFDERTDESILTSTSIPQDKCEVSVAFDCWHHNLNFINKVVMM